MAFKTISNPNLKSKVYEITFDAISSDEYNAKKLETIEEIKLKGLIEDELEVAIEEINAEPVPQKTLKAVIQEPQFKQLALGLGALMSINGNMDLATAGKVIFDTCCVEYDSELDTNGRAMIMLAIQLATDYVIPMSAEIKKK
jgi:hypothetical protein